MVVFLKSYIVVSYNEKLYCLIIYPIDFKTPSHKNLQANVYQGFIYGPKLEANKMSSIDR